MKKFPILTLLFVVLIFTGVGCGSKNKKINIEKQSDHIPIGVVDKVGEPDKNENGGSEIKKSDKEIEEKTVDKKISEGAFLDISSRYNFYDSILCENKKFGIFFHDGRLVEIENISDEHKKKILDAIGESPIYYRGSNPAEHGDWYNIRAIELSHIKYTGYGAAGSQEPVELLTWDDYAKLYDKIYALYPFSDIENLILSKVDRMVFQVKEFKILEWPLQDTLPLSDRYFKNQIDKNILQEGYTSIDLDELEGRAKQQVEELYKYLLTHQHHILRLDDPWMTKNYYIEGDRAVVLKVVAQTKYSKKREIEISGLFNPPDLGTGYKKHWPEEFDFVLGKLDNDSRAVINMVVADLPTYKLGGPAYFNSWSGHFYRIDSANNKYYISLNINGDFSKPEGKELFCQ